MAKTLLAKKKIQVKETINLKRAQTQQQIARQKREQVFNPSARNLANKLFIHIIPPKHLMIICMHLQIVV